MNGNSGEQSSVSVVRRPWMLILVLSVYTEGRGNHGGGALHSICSFLRICSYSEIPETRERSSEKVF